MPAGIGYTFAPGSEGQQQGPPGQGGQGMSPSQAVKLLQLRVPERNAPSGLAPQGLLQGQGGMGMQGGGSLQAIIRMLMMRGGQGMSGGLPSPHITPGVNDPNPSNPPELQNLNLPPNIAQLMQQYRQMVPGGGFTGGMYGGGNQPSPQQAPPLF